VSDWLNLSRLFGLFLLLVGCSSPNEQPVASVAAKALAINEAHAYARVTTDKQGAVASVNPIATQAGINAFAAGGNALDAALAVAFTLGVVDSHNSGIGGGCFILVRLADGRVLAIDGREMAPAAAHKDMFVRNGVVVSDLSKTGALASGVPGSVAALHQLQTLGGKLSFADVVAPAAVVAEQGFAVDLTLAKRLEGTRDRILQFPATAAIFLDDQQQPLKAGTQLRQRDLAESYRNLAKQGPDWFYKGEFAQKTAQWMKANGGVLTAADFANYHTVVRQPIQSQFYGYTIYGFPPPSSGGVHLAQMLNILQNFELPTLTETERTHLFAESMRLAFADRAEWLGDADFVPVPKGLIGKDYAQQLAKKIRLDVAAPSVSFGVPEDATSNLFDKHTTHIATADKEGNWVAITTTLNTSFGSKVVVPGTGVLLNNQMDDFAVQPGVPNAFGLIGEIANSVAPGKRPLSSMTPTFVAKDGQPVLTLGAAGGPTIINQVMQVLVRHLALEQSLDDALAGYRVHHQWQPNKLFVEDRVPLDVQQSLIAKGHELQSIGSFGGTQAIGLENGEFKPVTEPRVIERNASEK
jgi:gamma-glutamyltranspeptidase / glutathione hydrolase